MVAVIVIILVIGNNVWWGNLRERDHLEDPCVDGRIILRWFSRKWDVGGYGLDRSGSG